MLFGRGDDAAVCSFCGESRFAVETIVAGPGATAICNRCIFSCQRVLLENSAEPRFRRRAQPEHARSVHIHLSHEKVALESVERLALPDLIQTLVRSLPQSELLGWEYFNGRGRFDLLAIEIVSTATLSSEELRAVAERQWQALRNTVITALRLPANGEQLPLMMLAERLNKASREFAETAARDAKLG